MPFNRKAYKMFDIGDFIMTSIISIRDIDVLKKFTLLFFKVAFCDLRTYPQATSSPTGSISTLIDLKRAVQMSSSASSPKTALMRLFAW